MGQFQITQEDRDVQEWQLVKRFGLGIYDIDYKTAMRFAMLESLNDKIIEHQTKKNG